MAVHHEVLPPTIGCDDPHELLTAEQSALRALRKAEPWPRGLPVRAGVTAMGFGGINTHIVLENGQPRRRVPAGQPLPRPRRLAAGRRAAARRRRAAAQALRERLQRLVEFVPAVSCAELGDLAATLHRRTARPAVPGGRWWSPRREDGERQLRRVCDALDAGEVRLFSADGRCFLGPRARPGPHRLPLPRPGVRPRHLDGGALRRRFAERGGGLPAGGAAEQPATWSPPRWPSRAIVTGSLAGLRALSLLGPRRDGRRRAQPRRDRRPALGRRARRGGPAPGRRRARPDDGGAQRLRHDGQHRRPARAGGRADRRPVRGDRRVQRAGADRDRRLGGRGGGRLRAGPLRRPADHAAVGVPRVPLPAGGAGRGRLPRRAGGGAVRIRHPAGRLHRHRRAARPRHRRLRPPAPPDHRPGAVQPGRGPRRQGGRPVRRGRPGAGALRPGGGQRPTCRRWRSTPTTSRWRACCGSRRPRTSSAPAAWRAPSSTTGWSGRSRWARASASSPAPASPPRW